MTPSDEVKKRFPRGKKVSGIVRSHCPFGYFINIPGIEIPGLVETIGLKLSQREYPDIGSEIEAVIIDFRDPIEPLRRQFRLTVDPGALANPGLIKPLDD